MQKVKGSSRVLRIAQCGLLTAVLCILSPIAIPIGPIPITLGVFAVMLCGVMLDWKQAGAAVLAYLCLGAIGLPVFSGGGSGIGTFAGPTGGYLWSFLPMAVLIAFLSRRTRKSRGLEMVIAVGACALATLLCYLVGTWQFTIVTETDWKHALSVCVYPFVPFDLGKALAASALGVQIRRRLYAMGLR